MIIIWILSIIIVLLISYFKDINTDLRLYQTQTSYLPDVCRVHAGFDNSKFLKNEGFFIHEIEISFTVGKYVDLMSNFAHLNKNNKTLQDSPIKSVLFSHDKYT